MASVGMLTFHSSPNYGAVLQTAALYSVLVRLGHDPEIIDFQNASGLVSTFSRPRRMVHWVWRERVAGLLAGPLRESRTQEFREAAFRCSPATYRRSEELAADPPQYDAYVVGSDQVWNLAHTNGNTSYLLDFVPAERRRISYAASFGHDRVRNGSRSLLARHLSQFNAISVRESSAVDIVEQLIGRRPVHVLDPTLLLTAADWRMQASASSAPNDYMVAYYMPGNSELTTAMRRIVRRVSKQLGLPVVNLGQREHRALYRWERNEFGAGPAEFLSLFMGAAAVVTNSFHGTAFAISFEKPFVSVFRPPGDSAMERSGRITSLLSMLGLDERGLTIGDPRVGSGDVAGNLDLDFASSRRELERHREVSLDFLRNSI